MNFYQIPIPAKQPRPVRHERPAMLTRRPERNTHPAPRHRHRDLEELYPNAIPPLPADEEGRLIRRWQQHGDEAAREKLVLANVRFVVRVAMEYLPTGLELAELAAEGLRGLLTAIDRFDTSRGYKLISFAVHWIRQAIRIAIPQHLQLVRQPQNIGQVSSRVLRERHDLEQEQERHLSMSEVADELGEEVVSDLHRDLISLWEQPPVSLDIEIDDSYNGRTLADVLLRCDDGTQERLEAEEFRAWIHGHIAQLTERERQVIELYFGFVELDEKPTLETISKRFGLTRERIRQIKQIALTKLKKAIERERAAAAREAELRAEAAEAAG